MFSRLHRPGQPRQSVTTDSCNVNASFSAEFAAKVIAAQGPVTTNQRGSGSSSDTTGRRATVFMPGLRCLLQQRVASKQAAPATITDAVCNRRMQSAIAESCRQSVQLKEVQTELAETRAELSALQASHGTEHCNWQAQVKGLEAWAQELHEQLQLLKPRLVTAEADRAALSHMVDEQAVKLKAAQGTDRKLRQELRQCARAAQRRDQHEDAAAELLQLREMHEQAAACAAGQAAMCKRAQKALADERAENKRQRQVNRDLHRCVTACCTQQQEEAQRRQAAERATAACRQEAAQCSESAKAQLLELTQQLERLRATQQAASSAEVAQAVLMQVVDDALLLKARSDLAAAQQQTAACQATVDAAQQQLQLMQAAAQAAQQQHEAQLAAMTAAAQQQQAAATQRSQQREAALRNKAQALQAQLQASQEQCCRNVAAADCQRQQLLEQLQQLQAKANSAQQQHQLALAASSSKLASAKALAASLQESQLQTRQLQAEAARQASAAAADCQAHCAALAQAREQLAASQAAEAELQERVTAAHALPHAQQQHPHQQQRQSADAACRCSPVQQQQPSQTRQQRSCPPGFASQQQQAATAAKAPACVPINSALGVVLSRLTQQSGGNPAAAAAAAVSTAASASSYRRKASASSATMGGVNGSPCSHQHKKHPQQQLGGLVPAACQSSATGSASSNAAAPMALPSQMQLMKVLQEQQLQALAGQLQSMQQPTVQTLLGAWQDFFGTSSDRARLQDLFEGFAAQLQHDSSSGGSASSSNRSSSSGCDSNIIPMAVVRKLRALPSVAGGSSDMAVQLAKLQRCVGRLELGNPQSELCGFNSLLWCLVGSHLAAALVSLQQPPAEPLLKALRQLLAAILEAEAASGTAKAADQWQAAPQPKHKKGRSKAASSGGGSGSSSDGHPAVTCFSLHSEHVAKFRRAAADGRAIRSSGLNDLQEVLQRLVDACRADDAVAEQLRPLCGLALCLPGREDCCWWDLAPAVALRGLSMQDLHQLLQEGLRDSSSAPSELHQQLQAGQQQAAGQGGLQALCVARELQVQVRPDACQLTKQQLAATWKNIPARLQLGQVVQLPRQAGGSCMVLKAVAAYKGQHYIALQAASNGSGNWTRCNDVSTPVLQTLPGSGWEEAAAWMAADNWLPICLRYEQQRV